MQRTYYLADEDGTIHLPYDTATGELKPQVWERWLAWDPARMVPAHAETLRTMKAIYIDPGAEAFRRALNGLASPTYTWMVIIPGV